MFLRFFCFILLSTLLKGLLYFCVKKSYTDFIVNDCAKLGQKISLNTPINELKTVMDEFYDS